MQEFKDGMCVSSPEELIGFLRDPTILSFIQVQRKSFFIFLKGKDISDITEMVEISRPGYAQLTLNIYEDKARSGHGTVRKLSEWVVDYISHPKANFYNIVTDVAARKLFEQKKEAYAESLHAGTVISKPSSSPDISTLPLIQTQQLQHQYPSKAKIFGSIAAASLLAGAGVAALYAYKTGLFAASAFTLSMLAPPVAIMLGAAVLVWTALSFVALCCLYPRNQRSHSAEFFGSANRYAGRDNDLSGQELVTYTK